MAERPVQSRARGLCTSRNTEPKSAAPIATIATPKDAPWSKARPVTSARAQRIAMPAGTETGSEAGRVAIVGPLAFGTLSMKVSVGSWPG